MASRILTGRTNFPVCLAPMVGLTHVAFRRLVRSYLPAGAVTTWPTEMLNSRRLPNERVGDTPETWRMSDETDLVPQILGNEEKEIAESVTRLESWGASAIDINMGCPVKLALKHNYGVALMGDRKYAAEVVRMTVRNTKLPVSVKLRAGQQSDLVYLEDFMKGLVDAGASWLTLHPRLAGEGRRGFARWEQIGLMREKLGIPVIGNGDIQTSDDVFAMLEETGCEMVMAGRALTARPWLMWQVGEKLGFGAPAGREGLRAPRTPEEEGREYGVALLALLAFFKERVDANPAYEDRAVRQFSFYVRTSCVWLDYGHALYTVVSNHRTIESLRAAIAAFFEQPVRMSQRTDLRS